MKERHYLATRIIVVCAVVMADLCKPTEQSPLCRSGAYYCDGRNRMGHELPSYSSRYRALEYDETAMKLLMEMLLRQHNTFPEDDEDYEDFKSEADDNQSFPTTENSIMNASQNNKTITTIVINPALHGQADQPYSNPVEPFLQLQNQINPKESNIGFQRNATAAIAKTFEELSSIDEPEQFLSIVDSYDDNRFYSILPAHAEHFGPNIEWGIQDSGKQAVATVTTRQPTSNSSVSIKNMLSSKYKDTRRTSSTLNHGQNSILLRPRPFDGFTETLLPLPSSSSLLEVGKYREHFKRPATKPKKKINSLNSSLADRDQDVRSEIQLEILNRPISAGSGKPMTRTTPPGVGCENATSCSRSNKKKLIDDSIKVKIGQKPAKMTMAMAMAMSMSISMTTTTERGILGKPGIRFSNFNPNSVANARPSSVSTTKPDGNLISALASIVEDSDENDAEAEASDEEKKDDDEEYSDEKEDLDEYSYTSHAENRKNFAFSKYLLPTRNTGTDVQDDDADDDDDTSSDVKSSVMEEVNALI